MALSSFAAIIALRKQEEKLNFAKPSIKKTKPAERFEMETIRIFGGYRPGIRRMFAERA